MAEQQYSVENYFKNLTPGSNERPKMSGETIFDPQKSQTSRMDSRESTDPQRSQISRIDSREATESKSQYEEKSRTQTAKKKPGSREKSAEKTSPADNRLSKPQNRKKSSIVYNGQTVPCVRGCSSLSRTRFEPTERMNPAMIREKQRRLKWKQPPPDGRPSPSSDTVSGMSAASRSSMGSNETSKMAAPDMGNVKLNVEPLPRQGASGSNEKEKAKKSGELVFDPTKSQISRIDSRDGTESKSQYEEKSAVQSQVQTVKKKLGSGEKSAEKKKTSAENRSGKPQTRKKGSIVYNGQTVPCVRGCSSMSRTRFESTERMNPARIQQRQRRLKWKQQAAAAREKGRPPPSPQPVSSGTSNTSMMGSVSATSSVMDSRSLETTRSSSVNTTKSLTISLPPEPPDKSIQPFSEKSGVEHSTSQSQSQSQAPNVASLKRKSDSDRMANRLGEQTRKSAERPKSKEKERPKSMEEMKNKVCSDKRQQQMTDAKEHMRKSAERPKSKEEMKKRTGSDKRQANVSKDGADVKFASDPTKPGKNEKISGSAENKDKRKPKSSDSHPGRSDERRTRSQKRNREKNSKPPSKNEDKSSTSKQLNSEIDAFIKEWERHRNRALKPLIEKKRKSARKGRDTSKSIDVGKTPFNTTDDDEKNRGNGEKPDLSKGKALSKEKIAEFEGLLEKMNVLADVSPDTDKELKKTLRKRSQQQREKKTRHQLDPKLLIEKMNSIEERKPNEGKELQDEKHTIPSKSSNEKPVAAVEKQKDKRDDNEKTKLTVDKTQRTGEDAVDIETVVEVAIPEGEKRARKRRTEKKTKSRTSRSPQRRIFDDDENGQRSEVIEVAKMTDEEYRLLCGQKISGLLRKYEASFRLEKSLSKEENRTLRHVIAGKQTMDEHKQLVDEATKVIVSWLRPYSDKTTEQEEMRKKVHKRIFEGIFLHKLAVPSIWQPGGWKFNSSKRRTSNRRKSSKSSQNSTSNSRSLSHSRTRSSRRSRKLRKLRINMKLKSGKVGSSPKSSRIHRMKVLGKMRRWCQMNEYGKTKIRAQYWLRKFWRTIVFTIAIILVAVWKAVSLGSLIPLDRAPHKRFEQTVKEERTGILLRQHSLCPAQPTVMIYARKREGQGTVIEKVKFSDQESAHYFKTHHDFTPHVVTSDSDETLHTAPIEERAIVPV